MFKRAAQWLRQPVDERLVRLRAHNIKLTGQLRTARRERDEACGRVRALEREAESLRGQLLASHDTARELRVELKLSQRQVELLEQIVEAQQSREERNAKTNIAHAEAALKQVERLAGGIGSEGLR